MPRSLQVQHIVARKSADDVSYRFVGIHGLGLVAFIIYLISQNAIIGYIFSFLELGLTITVAMLKYYYSNMYESRIAVRESELDR